MRPHGSVPEPAFSLGIEEEYLLVSRESRDLVADPPPSLMAECEALLEGQVRPELLRSQIEVSTRPCRTLAEARADLCRLRATVARVAAGHGLAPIAASTHPFGLSHLQQPSAGERYALMARDLQEVGRRQVICGMHVHVGIDDPELRIDLMNQVAYFLPHLLALSTSSPFWEGENTGLKSYRISVSSAMPRTGLPEVFDSFGEYQRHVQVLINTGLIEDARKIWWDLRPSVRYPTLELRITDVCTRLDDGIGIAALYRCLLRMLYRLRRSNQRWRIYARMLINENRWRAQRYGFDEGLVDFGRDCTVPFAETLDELLEMTAPDAACFGCEAELARLREILTTGTSAHRQVRAFERALGQGASRIQALHAVVDGLIRDTVAGLEPPTPIAEAPPPGGPGYHRPGSGRGQESATGEFPPRS